eukprot:4225808-Pleurochrysis_carterae.AAC.1
MRVLVKFTYELEGDRLEILLEYERIEQLRQLGQSLRANVFGVLPNLDAVLRASAKIERGQKFPKVCPAAQSRI